MTVDVDTIVQQAQKALQDKGNLPVGLGLLCCTALHFARPRTHIHACMCVALCAYMQRQGAYMRQLFLNGRMRISSTQKVKVERRKPQRLLPSASFGSNSRGWRGLSGNGSRSYTQGLPAGDRLLPLILRVGCERVRTRCRG
jgi:hypothetical protein